MNETMWKRTYQEKMCQSQRIPGAYWETTLRTMAAKRAIIKLLLFLVAILPAAPPAACMLLIDKAVAVAVGKMRFNSLAI